MSVAKIPKMLLDTDSNELNPSVLQQNDAPVPLQGDIGQQVNSGTDHRHPSELREVAERLKQGGDYPRATVRKLLSWFHVQMRGSFIVFWIREVMKELGISTEPDFDSVWIDSEISFVPVPPLTQSQQSQSTEIGMGKFGFSATLEISKSLAPVFVGGAMDDPTYRVAKLDAANKSVISVTPNQSLEHAITLMLAHDFSQLPVMQGDRDVKGVITWEGVGASLSLGRTCKEVREFMSSAQIISSEKSLLLLWR